MFKITKKPVALILMFCALSIFAHAKAKIDTSIYFMKNSGDIVSVKDSADFIMLVISPDSTIDKSMYKIMELYKTGSIRRTSTAKRINKRLIGDGHFIEYYENGKRKRMGNMNTGVISGLETTYFPNGKLYSVKEYGPPRTKWIECRDSTGNILVQNGTGRWVELSENFKDTLGYGNVVDTVMDGKWTIIKNDTQYLVNSYKMGKLVESKTLNRPGIKDDFRPIDKAPEFPGGMEAFGRFLGTNIRYPRRARENRTQGRVVVSFIVERDGSIADPAVVRGIGDGCDEEALRLVKLMPKWNPGLQNNIPVRVAFSMPVVFSIE